MGFIWTIIIGFVAGVIAKFIMPGDNEPAGFILTTSLGIVGAFVATYLGQALGWYRPGEGAGLVGAVVGAIMCCSSTAWSPVEAAALFDPRSGADTRLTASRQTKSSRKSGISYGRRSAVRIELCCRQFSYAATVSGSPEIVQSHVRMNP